MRIAQNMVKDKILETFTDLQDDDVQTRSTGANGEDIILSPKARAKMPYSIEVKNQERLSIWQALKQSESNAGDYTPLLIFKRNRSKTYAVVDLDFFMLLNKRCFGEEVEK